MTTQDTVTEFAYLSGLLLGWADSLEKNSRSKEGIIKDMKDMSNQLAILAKVDLGIKKNDHE